MIGPTLVHRSTALGVNTLERQAAQRADLSGTLRYSSSSKVGQTATDIFRAYTITRHVKQNTLKEAIFADNSVCCVRNLCVFAALPD